MAQVVVMDNKDLVVLPSQYNSCRWAGNTRNQGIGINDIDLIFLKYPDPALEGFVEVSNICLGIIEFINSLRAKLFRGNINKYLHFMPFLHTDMP